MLQHILKYYCESSLSFKQFPKLRWLSLTYPLSPKTVQEDGNIYIRCATEQDIANLASHKNADDNIIQSSLKFWHTYGFRTLYLGFFDGEDDPSVFQFVLDQDHNHLFEQMEYGGMYRKHSPHSAQVENIYLFRNKRKKRAAIRFEHHLFAMLYNRGIQEVRTHVHLDNRAAILWARNVGFSPDKWITLVQMNFPGLRWLPKKFVHTHLQNEEFTVYPLSLFEKPSTGE